MQFGQWPSAQTVAPAFQALTTTQSGACLGLCDACPPCSAHGGEWRCPAATDPPLPPTPCPYTTVPSAQAVGHGHRPAAGDVGGPLWLGHLSGHQPRRPHLRVRLLRLDSHVRAWGCLMLVLLALYMVVRGAVQPQHDTYTFCPYTPAHFTQAVGHGHRPAEGDAGGPL